MVRIRLFRTGATKRPQYRIVVMDGRTKRQGRPLQNLGTYAPLDGGALSLDEDRLQYWLGKGAQMSDTVGSLVRRYRKQRSAEVSAPPPAALESPPTESSV